MNALKNLWKQHGTKILGGSVAGLGLLAAATPAQFQLWGINAHTGLRISVIALGLLTILRGFTNSVAQTPPAPPAAGDGKST
jgi:hypothetical protein